MSIQIYKLISRSLILVFELFVFFNRYHSLQYLREKGLALYASHYEVKYNQLLFRNLVLDKLGK